MDTLQKVSIPQVAAQLPFPFSMVDLAFVDDIVVSVYICQGVVDRHKHTDNDELFWTYEGLIVLDSEWGWVAMEPGDTALVPKGVGHRTGAEIRSSVLLIRCGVLPHRKNGRRRIYALPGAGKVKKVNLFDIARSIPQPFLFTTASSVEDALLQVGHGSGVWPSEEIQATRSAMYVVLAGSAIVITAQDMLHLNPGELTVIPKGLSFRLSTGRDTILARLKKASPA